ncbi:MAG: BatA domain-containing protein, partial [Pirellulaceae bacterium]
MTFLNGLLAFGAIAAVLPLAIHLLNRQRFEIIDWAAMHLIAAVHHANQRRWRWQELLLLLVRCAIPILLALALARPVLTSWRAAGGGQPSTTIVLLDDSASMRRSMPDGGNAFDEARRRISLALNQSAAGSEANIVLAGGEFLNLADVATTDLDGLLESLEQRDPSSGSLDLRGAGQSAMNQIVTATNPWRRLLIL